MNYLIITDIYVKQEIKSIVKEHELKFGSHLINENLLESMFSWLKVYNIEEQNFMKINLGICPDNQKISRNFIDFIQLFSEKSS
jgi:hypothetical protein